MKPHLRRWPLFPKEGVLDSTCGDDRHDSATHYLKWKFFQKKVSQKQHVVIIGMTQLHIIFKVKMFSEEGVSETTCGDERDDPAASYFK